MNAIDVSTIRLVLIVVSVNSMPAIAIVRVNSYYDINMSGVLM